MHKSITELLTKDGKIRPISEEVLAGLNINDREKPLTESNKKAIAKVLSLVDSGTAVKDAINQAKAESYPQPASAITVTDSKGGLTHIAQEVAESVDTQTLDAAIKPFQHNVQAAMVGAVVDTMTNGPGVVSNYVQGQMYESLKDPDFVKETNRLLQEAITEVLKK